MAGSFEAEVAGSFSDGCSLDSSSSYGSPSSSSEDPWSISKYLQVSAVTMILLTLWAVFLSASLISFVSSRIFSNDCSIK